MNFMSSVIARISAYTCIILLTACQLNSSTEEKASGIAMPEKGDTLNVTKYSVKSEISYALKDWKPFAANDAVVFTPADWENYNIDGALVLMPPNSVGGDERLTFNRYAQDLPDANYDKVVKVLYSKAFANYRVLVEDKLKKMELEKGTMYEKSLELTKDKVPYKGYFLVYMTQNHIYEYIIVLTQSRLNDYDGSLMQDIASNLSVGGNELFGTNNRIRNIIML